MPTATTTYGSALAKIGVTIPGHLFAEVEVPVLTKPQAQGDLLIVPAAEDTFDISAIEMTPVPNDGVQVVYGEATGHTHWLHRGFDSPGITWGRNGRRVDFLVEGVIHVPDGEVAELIHSDEHGCNAMGPGTYVIRGKREQADEISRVAD